MAYIFTLLFLLTAYVTPVTLFGQLALYRIELLVAVTAVCTAVPGIVQSALLKAPQTRALSIATGGWIGGGVYALYDYMIVAFGFLLTGAVFCKPWHFKATVIAMLLGSAYFIANGLHDLYLNVSPSDYLWGDADLRRLRGLGFVHDPNDLAQVLVSLLPLCFLLKTKIRLVNVVVIGLPIALLVTGMFYTHSRGSAVALMAVIMFMFRRKIGTVPAVILGAALFAGSLALGWSGGRDVSMEAGADRLDAWAAGLGMIRAHPVTGVGFGQFAEFNDITAHNSIIVCAAEDGLLGFICWTFFVFATVRAGLRLSAPATSEAKETVPGTNALTVRWSKAGPTEMPPRTPFAIPVMRTSLAAPGPPLPLRMPAPRHTSFTSVQTNGEPADPPAAQEEIRRYARLLLASLTGFLTAGWFLSRAVSIWLFMYCGMMFALTRMAKSRGLDLKYDSVGFLLKWSVLISIGLLLLVYVTLRLRKLTGH